MIYAQKSVMIPGWDITKCKDAEEIFDPEIFLAGRLSTDSVRENARGTRTCGQAVPQPLPQEGSAVCLCTLLSGLPQSRSL